MLYIMVAFGMQEKTLESLYWNTRVQKKSVFNPTSRLIPPYPLFIDIIQNNINNHLQ